MPKAAMKPCSYPGCSELVESGRCLAHSHFRDMEYRDAERQKLYNTFQWRQIRKKQLTAHPWCEKCLSAGIYTPATDVHHLKRHEGNVETFFSSPLQSLCHSCHSSETIQEVNERGIPPKKVLKWGI